MSSLSVMESKLPLGFRFHPRDEELISDYLAAKVSGNTTSGFATMMVDVDLNKCEPWDLPEMARVSGNEWYFYSLHGQKYASGKRTNRATASGYWKATGKDRLIVDPRRGELVGMRKTLVFHQGSATKGKKTDWIMHEFRMERSTSNDTTSFSNKGDWVLCRVFHKKGGFASKSSANNSNDNTCASSLSSFVDTSNSFVQAHLNVEGCKQLGYFSTHPPIPDQQPQLQSSSATLHIRSSEENMAKTMNSFTHSQGMPDLASYLNTSFYERTGMKELLDHLTGQLRGTSDDT